MIDTENMNESLLQKQQLATAWFRQLRDMICSELQQFEPEGAVFERQIWDRDSLQNPSAIENDTKGGGEISVLRGTVFEKAGVNISCVHGEFSTKFRQEIPGADRDPRFWAAGISLVIHPLSPKIPAVHLNTRMIQVGDPKAKNPKLWFGGGADLTPMQPNPEDAEAFHRSFEQCCAAHQKDYQEYRQWCDRYFYLPHRDEPRGIGGIFYDYVQEDWHKDFAFTQDVGRHFLDVYRQLVARHIDESWTNQDREAQLHKRGRYVEFNLLHDRGTRFGLMTGGNTEAILMSMPPVVKWQ